jgi:hypothetical protein
MQIWSARGAGKSFEDPAFEQRLAEPETTEATEERRVTHRIFVLFGGREPISAQSVLLP